MRLVVDLRLTVTMEGEELAQLMRETGAVSGAELPVAVVRMLGEQIAADLSDDGSISAELLGMEVLP